ncbi:MAG: type II secretion system F family protein [Dethiobacter sp.]|nr:type II secretion system F family protein [Dethiobacter sp.]
MAVIPALLAFSLVFCVLQAVATRLQPERVDLTSRLPQAIPLNAPLDVRKAELKRSAGERLLRPLLLKASRLGGRMLPAGILQSLEPKIQRAGLSWEFSASECLGIKVLLAVILPVLLYPVASGAAGILLPIFLLALAVAAGWKAPDYYLSKKTAHRARLLEKSFPDTLDLLTVSVEAGLGFDGALAKVAEKSTGIIAGEFRRVLQEIKMGKSRREALKFFAERTAVDDIRSFVSAIIQAEQLGLGIGATLRNQSEQMRRKRRQRVEEQAMKAPVKMLLPLIVFIFPTIFLVLLGPALIQILEGLGR